MSTTLAGRQRSSRTSGIPAGPTSLDRPLAGHTILQDQTTYIIGAMPYFIVATAYSIRALSSFILAMSYLTTVRTYSSQDTPTDGARGYARNTCHRKQTCITVSVVASGTAYYTGGPAERHHHRASIGASHSSTIAAQLMSSSAIAC